MTKKTWARVTLHLRWEEWRVNWEEGKEGSTFRAAGRARAKALRQRDHGEEQGQKPVWLEQSDRGRYNKRLRHQQGKILVFP